MVWIGREMWGHFVYLFTAGKVIQKNQLDATIIY